ncbi:hypothetical protein XH86_34985 [Bradyrhizobium guangdongense]|uniref:Secreted protein n=1 Tax=Bradyrhizobium guangdongense TaxID=1325090 RepID=A0ABX6UPM9_9BRAD|nr:hypothetical protein X265_34945 [Bradyrhizobium guangdongense]QOZ63356.1 hypothetical protein XH86_34985 [Bradyrhizobium guangdongense]
MRRSHPGSLRGKILDCFAALAMTVCVEAASRLCAAAVATIKSPPMALMVTPRLRPSRRGLAAADVRREQSDGQP